MSKHFERYHLQALIIVLFTGSFGHSQPSSVFLDTKPVLISKNFSFTEGPAADRDGNIYFTDQPNNKIWKYGTDGQFSLFLDGAGRSNGMYFDNNGNLVTCADEEDQLWSINKDGKVTVLLKDFNGHRFNGPNDLWIDKTGGIYFTDPYFQRDYWQRKSPDPLIAGEKLYYLSAVKNTAVIADGDLIKPNGITGTADGKYLYVSDMGKRVIYKYEILEGGFLSNRKVFANDLADGMKLDERGNLYLAGMGVTVYNALGKKIDHADIPEPWTANLCFGGKNGKMLFITASKAVYKMPMQVAGMRRN